MKILVLGSSDDYIDGVVDVFSSAGIGTVGKVVPEGGEAFCNAVEEAILNRGYDAVVGSTEDYINATIELNKNNRIRAVSVRSRQELVLSRASNPNVFIIDNDNMPLVRDLVSGMRHMQSGEPAMEPKQKQLKKRDLVERPVEQAQVQQRQTHKRAPQADKGDNVEQEYRDYEEEHHHHSKKGGLFGRLKDSLGIIDEGKS